MAGITPQGFIRKTSQEIIEELRTAWQEAFPNAGDISDDSIAGQFIGLFAAMNTEAWEGLEASYNSNVIDAAEGNSLAKLLNLLALRAKQASPSTVEVSFRGDNSTIIPQGTQVKQSSTNLSFQTIVQGAITQSATNWIELIVNSIVNNALYSITISNNVYQYTSSASATANEIIAAFKSDIEASIADITVTDQGSSAMLIESNDKNNLYNIVPDSKLTINKVQSVIEVECLEIGENIVEANSIDQIINAVAGLDSIRNYFDGQTGRADETDQEFRNRGRQSPKYVGRQTVGANRARILNDIDGVSYCQVYNNPTLEVSPAGIPPKSWEAVVEGGADNNIANKIYIESTIGGIAPSGNLTIVISDSQGLPVPVKFSRPENLFIWIKITIDSYNPEEATPINLAEAIRAQVLEYANNTFNIGDVIVLQKLYTPLYQIKGIGSATILLSSAISETVTPIYSTDNINCNIRQKPVFSTNRIEVII